MCFVVVSGNVWVSSYAQLLGQHNTSPSKKLISLHKKRFAEGNQMILEPSIFSSKVEMDPLTI